VYCTRVKIGETTAIVCHGGRRPRACSCGKPATRACDWIVGRIGKRVQRCSAPICDDCTTRPAPDKDLCAMHRDAWERHPKNATGIRTRPALRRADDERDQL
jgi:hypothetical protein